MQDCDEDKRPLGSQLNALRGVLDGLGALIFTKDCQGIYTYANQRFCKTLGVSPDGVIGHRSVDFFDAETAERLHNDDQEVLTTGLTLSRREVRLNKDKHEERYYLAVKAPVFDSDGHISGLSGVLIDITEQQAAENELKRSEARFRVLFEASHNALVVFDEEHLIDCNQSTLELLGVPSREAFRRLNADMLAPPFQPCGSASSELAARHMEAARRNGHHQLEWTVLRHDNQLEIPVEVTLSALELDGQPALLATIRDLTERKRYEEQIHQLAYYDALTGLPNRRLFFDRLAQTLARSQRSGRHGAIIYLDLDNFKPLNDRHGHKAGDLLLQEVAYRLSACLRDEDTVARLGGDEFAVLLAQIDDSQPDSQRDATQGHALDVAERIRDALARPYLLSIDKGGAAAEQVEHHCSASVGVTLFPPCEMDGEAMLRRADAAMYAAKAAGRNQIRFAAG